MRQRCNNPRHRAYQHYGARGIKVCERWNDFQLFVQDMGDRPEGHTIERERNDLGYCPENCIWLHRMHQQNNSRKRKDITVHVPIESDRPDIQCTVLMSDSVSGWARRTGIDRRTISKRLQRGWTPYKALGIEESAC